MRQSVRMALVVVLVVGLAWSGMAAPREVPAGHPTIPAAAAAAYQWLAARVPGLARPMPLAGRPAGRPGPSRPGSLAQPRWPLAGPRPAVKPPPAAPVRSAPRGGLRLQGVARVPRYYVTDLGTLGGIHSWAYGISSVGQVVGYSYISDGSTWHAFRYDGTMHDLGTLGGSTSFAFGVNAAGQVVGKSNVAGDAAWHACLYDGSMHDLGTLGGIYSGGWAINEAGQIAGYSNLTAAGSTHAFLYDGALHDLGTLGGSLSEARAINGPGQIAGFSSVAGDSAQHAVLYDGSMHDLGTLGGSDSGAYAINGAGQAVGWSYLPSNSAIHAFLYDGSMHDLGTLGGYRSCANAINDAGQIVGQSHLAGDSTQHAFLVVAGTIRDLNDLIAAGSPFRYIEAANGINAAGEICGSGLVGTAAHAFKAVPNALPVATDDSYTTLRDAPLAAAGDGVLANDSDSDATAHAETLTATKVSDPAHGALTAFGPDGSFTYVPAADYVGADSFTYKVNDGLEDSATVATVSLNVAEPAARVVETDTRYATIQGAIDAAADGQTVEVVAGTHHERIDFVGKAITVRSTDPSNGAVVTGTILDGDAGGSVVVFNHGEGRSSVLRGLTITNGRHTGGGIRCEDASPTIEYNRIVGNQTEQAAWQYGGGIHAWNSSARIAYNLIAGNRTWGEGGSDGGGGGGLDCTGEAAEIIGNIIRSNRAGGAGGVGLGGGFHGILSGNIIDHNVALGDGAGIYCGGSWPQVVNCAIVHNQTLSGRGGGIQYDWPDPAHSAVIRNCIIAFSEGGPGLDKYSGDGVPEVTYCDVFGNENGDYAGGIAPGAGCLSADPLFADAANDDFHLKSAAGRWNGTTWVTDPVTSPCLDSGDPASPFADEPLPNGGHVNMGAYGNTAEASKSPLIARIVETDQYWGTIQGAIGAAVNGQTVEVGPGTHHERSDFLGKAITVRSTDPTNAAVVAGTVLDGDNGSSVVTFANGEGNGSVLKGLTLTHGTGTTYNYPGGGSTTWGGGVYCKDSSPTLQSCVIDANTAGLGGGLCSFGGSPVVEHSTIRNNTSDVAGGLYYEHGSPVLRYSTVSGNTSDHGTGGVYLMSCTSPVVTGNVIVQNSAEAGGGLMVYSCPGASVCGNVIARNTAYQGAGVEFARAGPVLFANNTVADNQGTGPYSCGLDLGDGATSITVKSCIITGSSKGGIVRDLSSGATVSYCDVWNNGSNGSYGYLVNPVGGVSGNIAADPLYADAANGDYHLKSKVGRWTGTEWTTDTVHSLCIDRGDPLSAYDQEPAYNGNAINMGAYGNTAEASKSLVAAAIAETGVQYGSIQAAILHAGTGQNVVVQPGEWHEQIRLDGRHITVRSTDPANGAVVAATVLNGGGWAPVVYCGNGETASTVVQGLTITNGSPSGAYCWQTSPTITGNIIRGNATTLRGGGVYCYQGSPAITNNLIVNNSCTGTGTVGGVCGEFCSNIVLRGDTIAGNMNGGAANGSVLLWGCTGTVSNSIVAFATDGAGYTQLGGGTVDLLYNDVYGNPGGNYGAGITPGAGCLSVDPIFADAASGDFHLKSAAGRWNGSAWVTDPVHSPCIDAGDPASPFANEPAPNGGRVNMGYDGNTAEASKSSPPPTLVSATYVDPTHVDLLFSQTLQPVSAETPGNYSVPYLTVSAPVLQPDAMTVRLTTTAQTAGRTYTAFANHVQNLFGIAMVHAGTAPWTATTAAPTVVSATYVDSTHVDVLFSKAVQQVSAETVGNYSVPYLTVSAAALQGDGTTVRLTTTPQPPGRTFTVFVNHVQDLAGHAMTTAGSASWNTPAASLTVVSATYVDTTHVDVLFSGAVQKASAETVGNYSVPYLTVSGAAVQADDKTARLTTGTQAPSRTYTVFVSHVQDAAGTPMGKPGTASWTTPLAVVRATYVDPTHVDVLFSAALDKPSAETVGNYTVPYLTVSAAALQADTRTVRLTTATQPPGRAFTAFVSRVQDAAGNVLARTNTATWNTPAASLTIVSATYVDPTHVDVLFSEAAEKASAETAANYSVPYLTVSLPAVQDDGKTVRLTTTAQAPGHTYTVFVSHVKNAAGTAMGRTGSAAWTAPGGPHLAGAVLALAGMSTHTTPAGAVLTYSLSAAAAVEIVVTNVAGRVVARVPGGSREAGTHTTLWSGRGLTGTRVPAGSYLVQVTARSADGASTSAVAALRL